MMAHDDGRQDQSSGMVLIPALRRRVVLAAWNQLNRQMGRRRTSKPSPGSKNMKFILPATKRNGLGRLEVGGFAVSGVGAPTTTKAMDRTGQVIRLLAGSGKPAPRFVLLLAVSVLSGH